MSNSRPDSIEKCIIDITECPICNDVLRDNRCLPCLHTFCLNCLESHKKKNSKGKSLSCPVCRREYPITKCAADLSRNFFIDKLIDAHKIKKQEVLSKNCDICSEDKTTVRATRYCCDCQQNLCISCERQHEKIKATKMHKIIDNSGVSDPQELAPRPTYCVIHKKKEAEVYCRDCRTVMCWECKSVSHSSHASVEISSAAKGLSVRLQEHIEEISEHLQTKQDDFLKLTEQEKLYTDEIDLELANICRELNKLYRNITNNGDKLKKALSAATSVHLDTYSRLRGKLDSDMSKLKKHKVYIEQMIHLGNVSDLCEYTEKLISETARMMSENTCNIIVPVVAHLSDLELQDHLIGRRMVTDEQYQRIDNRDQQQHDPLPDNYIKDNNYSREELSETSPVKLRRGESLEQPEKILKKSGSIKNKMRHIGNSTIDVLRPTDCSLVMMRSMSASPTSLFGDKDKKVPSRHASGDKTTKYGSPKSESSLSDETGTPAVAVDKSKSVVDKVCCPLESTDTTAVKILPNCAKNRDKRSRYGSYGMPKSESSLSDETDTPAVAVDKRKSVEDKVCCPLESTETTAVKILPNSVTNSVEPSSKYKWSQLRTVCFENGGAVCGITILNSIIYVVFQNSSQVHVCDSAVFIFRRSFEVDGLLNPNDIASCKFNNCLYVCDWGTPRVFRVTTGDRMEQIDWSIDTDLGGISVTADHNVLLAGYVSNKLKEYDTKGILLRSINLEADFKPWHAIKLASNDYLICQGNHVSEYNRVCLLDGNGKLKTSFGRVKGSEKEQLYGPYHLAVREDGCILVNDCNNRRILLLSPTLKFVKELIPSSENVLRRARRIHLDEAAGRLYVADNAAAGYEIKDGRILIFSITLL